MHMIRTLHAGEWSRYRAHLQRLDAADRRLRFGHTISDDGVAAFVAALARSRTRVLAIEDDALGVVGAAQVSAVGVDTAELAFSVERRMRGRGMGRALATRALSSARNRGYRRACLLTATDNLPMRRLAVAVGMTLAVMGLECEATAELPPATPWSVLAGLITEQTALTNRALRAYRLISVPAMPVPATGSFR